MHFNSRFNGIALCLRKEREESPLASSCFHPFLKKSFLLGSKTSLSQRKSEQNNNLGREHELARRFSSLWSIVTNRDAF